MILNRQEFLIASLLATFFGLLGSSWAQEVCSSPPNREVMNQQLLKSLAAIPQKSGVRILILPFEDRSQLSEPDQALSKAFAISLYDLISPLDHAAVFHPALSFGLVDQKRNLFDETTFINEARNQKATHLVLGLFQKHDQMVRVFLKVVDVEKGTLLQPVSEFALVENDRFFSILSDVATAILQQASKKKVSPDSFAPYLARAPSFEAFRYYIKGIEKSFSYNPVDLEIAKAWFEKSLMLSFKFSDAALEKKRVLWMLALDSRQMKKDTSLILSEAALIPAQPFVLLKGSASKLTYSRWESAFKLAHTATYLPVNQALESLKKALALTPEDSWLHYEQAIRLKQSGKPFADAHQMASQINTCIPPL